MNEKCGKCGEERELRRVEGVSSYMDVCTSCWVISREFVLDALEEADKINEESEQ